MFFLGFKDTFKMLQVQADHLKFIEIWHYSIRPNFLFWKVELNNNIQHRERNVTEDILV